MTWKTAIQVRDLDPDDRLELVCRQCGHLRYLTSASLQARKGARDLYMDEIEAKARCTQRGCNGTVRMALPPRGDTAGFVGGIA